MICLLSEASLFPKRKGPLPKSVLAAKRKNTALRHKHEQEEGGAGQYMVELDADEGWEDIPVYVKAFAEFETKKRLQNIHRQEELKKRTALV